MGQPSQTIGFHYLFSMLFGLGRGPIDELRAIKVGDEMAWEDHCCSDDLQAINKPNLFGGEEKEGGVQGLFRLNQGEADQVLPGPETGNVAELAGGTSVFTGGVFEIIFRVLTGGPYNGNRTLPGVKELITSETGGEMGELRGRVTLWFDGLVASMNPYIKEWKFRIRRARKGWHGDDPWYPEKAIIYLGDGRIFAMNPAHIIYECCTNPSWARGAPTSMIDDNAFTYAANLFCDEGLGLCLVWYRKEDIDQFVQTVLDHAAAVLYTDRETGKITLKAIRDDYELDDLPIFTLSSGLIDILEDDTGSSDTAFNEVIVTGHDPITDKDIQMRAHNLAAFATSGAPATLDQPYPGLPTTDLCARTAQRDLRVNAAGLRKFKVKLDRRGFRIHPGAVFRVQAPTRGIGDIVLRAGEIDDGKMLKGEIIVSAVQDVFGLPATSFVTPVDPIWTPPSGIAIPAVNERLFEITYRQAYVMRGAADANAAPVGSGFLGALASAPSVRSRSYDLLSRAEGETAWQSNAGFYFTGSAELVADLGPLVTEFVVADIVDFEAEDLTGQALLVGEEYMRIVSYDAGTATFTVARGAVDTWPSAHLAGTRVWLVDDDAASDGRAYVESELVEAKVLPRTSSDALPEEDATLLGLEIEARVARPYPPADVRVDTDSIYEQAGEYPEPVLTWVERNRLTQADTVVGFFEATVAHEAGTTYTARVFANEADVAPAGTHAAIASGWVYDAALQLADGTDGLTAVWFELVAVRDGVESIVPYRFRVALVGGWGYSWGFNWGGAG
jgi:hypothetical protein